MWASLNSCNCGPCYLETQNAHDEMLNGVYRICLWLFARQLWNTKPIERKIYDQSEITLRLRSVTKLISRLARALTVAGFTRIMKVLIIIEKYYIRPCGDIKFLFDCSKYYIVQSTASEIFFSTQEVSKQLCHVLFFI